MHSNITNNLKNPQHWFLMSGENMNGNQLASQNGEWGEKTALRIIENHFGKITFTNDLIDYVSDKGINIEIKSCQLFIESGNPKYPKRHGRFVLTKPQHTFLVLHDGYYVFLVKGNDLLIKARIIKANLIRFSPVVQWQRVFEINHDSGAICDKSQLVDVDISKMSDADAMPGNNGFVSKTTGV